MKVLTVVGARPQFIKAAMVSRAIEEWNGGSGSSLGRIQEVLVHTGQHYDDNMSDVFFRELEISPPAHNLAVGSGPHGQQTGRMLEGLERIMQKEKPDLALIYGDTNSTLAGGLAASKLQIPVAHVEAGLRSHNRTMPEEINRILVDHLSTLLFCPSTVAEKNLGSEGITKGVHLVGDVMYDSLLFNLNRMREKKNVLDRMGLRAGNYGVLTIHRAENADNPIKLREIVAALQRLNLPLVFPVHPRTQAALTHAGITTFPSLIRPTKPLSYQEMLELVRGARLILTDSGGVQKEAFLLRVPCVTLRNETEWVETVDAGWNRLAGTDPDKIVSASRELLARRPGTPGQPYGDGQAGQSVVRVMAEYLAGHCS
jgi:UDP-GlcNAc3NAcA epimerase